MNKICQMFKINKIKVKYLHELTEMLAFHVIQKACLESSQASMIELFCENR